jgi:UDP-N-acetylglucosamine 2-epimerase
VPGAHNLNSRLLDRLADELHTASAGDSHILIREGAASDHVHFIGSLPTRFLDAALGQMPGAGKVLEDYDLDAAQMLGRYGLIGWRCPPFGQAQAFVRMVLPVLRALGKEIPLVWPVRPTERTSLIVAGVNQQLAEAGVTVVREHGYIESLGLLRHARCLVAEDFGDLVEEAQALGRTHIVAGPDDHDLNLQGRDGQIMVGRDPELAARAVRAVLAEEAAAPGPLDADPATGNASLRLARWLLEWLGHEPRGTAHNVETME